MADGVLTTRQLNRALLARQHLLERSAGTPHGAVHRLVGMQMQDVAPPFVGLWSRLAWFERSDLTSRLADRSLVRATMMRATIHLATREDFLALWPAIRPGLDLAVRSVTRGAVTEERVARVVAALVPMLRERPLTASELRDAVAAMAPEEEVRPLT